MSQNQLIGITATKNIDKNITFKKFNVLNFKLFYSAM